MKTNNRKNWRTCEAKTQKKCRTSRGLTTLTKENETLEICEYHKNWHIEKGYVVVVKEYKPQERSYTVDGNVFVKESDFEKPKQKKFISNLFLEELSIEDFFGGK